MIKSDIEWTDTTWSPVIGCTKVSQGCKNCYAEREVKTRWDKNPKSIWYGRNFTDVLCRPDLLIGASSPLLWKRPRRIFVCPRADLFHEAVPDEFLLSVFAVMAACPQHTFQVLTKRAARMRQLLSASIMPGWPFSNVWLGVSVEDQAAADERIPLLLQTPAAVRWISAEPLLGAIDLRRFNYNYLDKLPAGVTSIDWVVAGGESGPEARPSHPSWYRGLRDQCAAAGVPFLFKQWGEWVPRSSCYHTFPDGRSCADIDPGAEKWRCIRLTESGGNARHIENDDGGDDAYMQRVGKKTAGRLLDGVLHDAYPEAAG